MKRRLPALFLLALLLAAHVPAPGYADTEENIQTIYTYLTETAGLNRAAACGILSNIKSESHRRFRRGLRHLPVELAPKFTDFVLRN